MMRENVRVTLADGGVAAQSDAMRVSVPNSGGLLCYIIAA
jgi:hypothetical protein